VANAAWLAGPQGTDNGPVVPLHCLSDTFERKNSVFPEQISISQISAK